MAWKKQETDDRLRKTKVDATLGPASWCEEKLKEMILAGTDIFRPKRTWDLKLSPGLMSFMTTHFFQF